MLDGTAGGDTSTQAAARRRDRTGDQEHISPLEAALLYGVMSPASYHEDDDESSDEDSSSSRLLSGTNNPQQHSNAVDADATSLTPSSWWTRVVSTLSPTPKYEQGRRSGKK